VNAEGIMKVDADDFRRVYESLNDEALLAVKRDELVEVAQQCYDVEVAARGLAAHDDAAAVALSGSSEAAGAGEELVEVATFTDLDDARLARDLLQSAEIPSYLANVGKLGLGGFRLSVSPSLLEQAREVLDTQVSDEELAAQAEAAAEHERVEESQDEM
jgi:hypothetical protein